MHQFSRSNQANMKAFTILALIAFSSLELHAVDLESEWKDFKIKYKKSYISSEEDAERFENFQENFEFIQQHNENASSTYKLEINREGDMTDNDSLKMMAKPLR